MSQNRSVAWRVGGTEPALQSTAASDQSSARAELGSVSAHQTRRRQDDQRLFERYCYDRRDLAARDALVNRFLPLALHLARLYDRGSGHAEDLAQVASLALLGAIERFDPGRGIAFSSYALPTIVGELKRYFRDKGWIVRVPRDLQERALAVSRAADELEGKLGRAPTAAQIADHLGASVEKVLEARIAASAHFGLSLDQPGPGGDEEGQTLADEIGAEEEGFNRAENADAVQRLLNSLSERERAILRLRFEHDLTQREIAARIGISQMHVSRLINRAITQLGTSASQSSEDVHVQNQRRPPGCKPRHPRG